MPFRAAMAQLFVEIGAEKALLSLLDGVRAT